MPQLYIADLLDPARVDLDCRLTSKKRLMEHVASMLARDSGVEEQAVFRVLIERERLGSTGVGHGVALPHGRIADIDDAILALATLNEPLDYQAPDKQHVQIVVGLLVPEHANAPADTGAPGTAPEPARPQGPPAAGRRPGRGFCRLAGGRSRVESTGPHSLTALEG